MRCAPDHQNINRQQILLRQTKKQIMKPLLCYYCLQISIEEKCNYLTKTFKGLSPSWDSFIGHVISFNEIFYETTLTHWFLGNKKKISNSLGSVNKTNEPFLYNLSLRYAYTLDDVIVLPSNFQRLLRWLSIWFCSYTLRTVQINSVKRYEYFISCLPRVVKHNSLHSLTVLLCLWVYDLFLYLIFKDSILTYKKVFVIDAKYIFNSN